MMRDARRRQHKYNVSFERDVGSEFDINFQDPAEVEKELIEGQFMAPSPTLIVAHFSDTEAEYGELPYDPEEELDAYFEQHSRQEDSEEDFEMGNIPSTKFRLGVPDDPFTTPQRLQRLAALFPSS